MFKGPPRAVACVFSRKATSIFLLNLLLAPASFATAQSASATPPEASNVSSSAALPDAPQAQAEAKEAITIQALPLNILKDQGPIWTSPFRIRTHDLIWVLPFAAATGVGIA